MKLQNFMRAVCIHFQNDGSTCKHYSQWSLFGYEFSDERVRDPFEGEGPMLR